jgi:hypothetical protein
MKNLGRRGDDILLILLLVANTAVFIWAKLSYTNDSYSFLRCQIRKTYNILLI